MKYGYEIFSVNCDESKYWIAESRALIKKGIENEKQRTVFGQGNTMEDAIKDLEEKEAKWIEMAEYCKLKIVEPTKKAIPSKKLKRRERWIILMVFLFSFMFASSSVFVGYQLMMGFMGSLLLTAAPLEIIRALNKKYTSIGYSSPLDKYHQYLEVMEKDE